MYEYEKSSFQIIAKPQIDFMEIHNQLSLKRTSLGPAVSVSLREMCPPYRELM